MGLSLHTGEYIVILTNQIYTSQLGRLTDDLDFCKIKLDTGDGTIQSLYPVTETYMHTWHQGRYNRSMATLIWEAAMRQNKYTNLIKCDIFPQSTWYRIQLFRNSIAHITVVHVISIKRWRYTSWYEQNSSPTNVSCKYHKQVYSKLNTWRFIQCIFSTRNRWRD